MILDTATFRSSRAFDVTRVGEPVTTPHGTQVASVILGVHGGTATPLPRERVKVTDTNVMTRQRPDLMLLVAGLRQARDLGAQLVNMSLGVRQPHPDLEAAVNDAHSAGILVVASAGNVRSLAPDYPARYDSALSVGAADREGRRYDLSPARGVDVTARGVDVPVLGLDGRPAAASGVSLATAMVSNEVAHDLLTGTLGAPGQYSERHVR